MQLKTDFSLLFSNKIGPNGLDNSILAKNKYSDVFKKIHSQFANKEHGFLEILQNTQIIDKCQDIFNKVSWAKTLVVVGIGGSDLGGRMLQGTLEKPNAPMEVIFIGDTTDPYPYYKLLTKINPEKTIVNIISKSGSTTETAAAYSILKNYFQQNSDNWTKHFVFTTDIKEGVLRKEADQNNILTLEVPDNVGGRFSVLTSVGLFPALAMGIDIDKLLMGAMKYSQVLVNLKDQSPDWQLALTQFLFQKDKNINTVVMMSYAVRLELFANWFRQLWAESSGKDGKGILPIKAIGPADQHSQIQFYNQGKWLSTFIFLSLEKYSHNLTITNTGSQELSYLENKNLETIIRTECDATRFSLANNGRPSVNLKLPELNEQFVGQLIILFEQSIVYLCELLSVNAFDQPGVEQGKEYMYSLLGKKGFEDKKKEIEKYL